MVMLVQQRFPGREPADFMFAGADETSASLIQYMLERQFNCRSDADGAGETSAFPSGGRDARVPKRWTGRLRSQAAGGTPAFPGVREQKSRAMQARR